MKQEPNQKKLRSIAGITLKDRQINKSCKTQYSGQKAENMNGMSMWKEWELRLTRICKTGRSDGKRSREQPSERWAQSWFSSTTDQAERIRVFLVNKRRSVETSAQAIASSRFLVVHFASFHYFLNILCTEVLRIYLNKCTQFILRSYYIELDLKHN